MQEVEQTWTRLPRLGREPRASESGSGYSELESTGSKITSLLVSTLAAWASLTIMHASSPDDPWPGPSPISDSSWHDHDGHGAVPCRVHSLVIGDSESGSDFQKLERNFKLSYDPSLSLKFATSSSSRSGILMVFTGRPSRNCDLLCVICKDYSQVHSASPFCKLNFG